MNTTEAREFTRPAFLERNDSMKTVIQHPETGEELTRNVFPRKITYKGLSKTIDMPGWYTKDGDDAVFTKEDLQVYDMAMKELKSKV